MAEKGFVRTAWNFFTWTIEKEMAYIKQNDTHLTAMSGTRAACILGFFGSKIPVDGSLISKLSSD